MKYFISFLLIALFSYQSIFDNDSICGENSIIENHCINSNYYSAVQEENRNEPQHVCINCFCNFVVSSQVFLTTERLFIEKIFSYAVPFNHKAKSRLVVIDLQRPPK